MRAHRLVLAWTMLALGLAMAGGLIWYSGPSMRAQSQQASLPSTAVYVGTPRCASCHTSQHQEWQKSHHDLAMQAATASSVLAPFMGERFTHDGITSTFTQRDGKFFVRTDGADGHLQDFEITHTLGLVPLQQYLIPMPDGGMQALTIAWDTRPKALGGQRWFHLQAGQRIRAGDEMHWTGRQNNWNFMCAECHTTQFKKNYNADTKTYASSWSAIHVACEACHGPGSNHADWAALPDARRNADPSYGLLQRLDERKEVEMCARCHAHRSQISDDYVHGKPLLDTHVPSLVDNQLFWPDGQMKAEVYNYASFQQSRMFQKGVTCSDCHNPHTLKLRAPGNQTCLQCHAAGKYESAQHHFHKAGSQGAQCAECHMPTTAYMVIDPRHDHSIRVPRPDLSARDGTPNACTQCHTGKPSAWAAKWAAQWYPNLSARPAPPVTTGSPVASASALVQAVAGGSPEALGRLTASLADSDPLVRKTAVDAMAGAPPEFRAQWLKPLTADPVRAVRIAAARWLAGISTAGWKTQDIANLQRASDEYLAVQRFNADRPEALSDMAMFHADQRNWPRAEALLKQAMDMGWDSPAAALNLADVYRAQGREAEVQATIEATIRKHPTSAAAQHALGLSLVRQQQYAQALKPLQRATQLEPANRGYAYVYQLAKQRR